MSTGTITSGKSLTSDVRTDCDVVVVGSGAGGAMAARELCRAGLSVVLLEEGGHHTHADFNQREGDMLPLLFQDGGGRATADGAVAILQGRGVGGSTVHNTNLCKRAPREVLARWVAEHGARGWAMEDLEADFAAVEAELHVTPMTEDDINRNNAVLRRGVERLGWRGGVLSHNRRGCVRSGFCSLGCTYDAKENALKVLIPDAVRRGLRLYAEVQAERVTLADKSVVVAGHALLGDGRPGAAVEVRARAVCLAGSAIGSAVLHRRSGLPDPHGLAGRGLRLHPGVAVAGLMDEPIEGWRGIPQSYECTEKLSLAPGARDRCWLLSAFAHPGGFAASLPGIGREHAHLMREYARTAVVAAMLHDESSGEVAVDRHGRPKIRYELSADDAQALLRGLHAAAEILFAAGARQVMVPLARPLLATRPADLAPLLSHRYQPLDPVLTSVHPMGTLPLGGDPRHAVVDPDGRHHHARGVYVADGSLFPTSLGGPPQITIYAAGRKVARTIVADLRR
jgi:choline dehydrogenase-like flavoprotein